MIEYSVELIDKGTLVTGHLRIYVRDENKGIDAIL